MLSRVSSSPGRNRRPFAPVQVLRFLTLAWISGSVIMATGGCYRYAPVDPDVITPTAEVRAHLLTSEVDRLQIAELFVVPDRTLEGLVVTAERDTLILLVPVLSGEDWSIPRRGLQQRLTIPRSGILEIEIKQLDRLRTGLLVGVGAVGLTSILIRQFTGWFGAELELPPEEPPKDEWPSGLRPFR